MKAISFFMALPLCSTRNLIKENLYLGHVLPFQFFTPFYDIYENLYENLNIFVQQSCQAYLFIGETSRQNLESKPNLLNCIKDYIT